MLNKTFLLIFIALLNVTYTFSQDLALNIIPTEDTKSISYLTATTIEPDFLWEFPEHFKSYVSEVDCGTVNDPFFGNEAACLAAIVDEKYFEKETPVPGDPNQRTIQLKPDVYKAIKSIKKHYQKSISTDQLSGSHLADYQHVLQVSLSIVYLENTAEFEKALRAEKKNASKQIDLFKKVKLI